MIIGFIGLGKISMFYVVLKELNLFEKCFVIVEDFIEYEIEGIV